MSVVATIAAVVLGVVFVLAGAAKVARRGQWLTDAATLGTPRLVAVVVPWVEIGLGALLVARVGLPWTAVAVLMLLAAFNGLLLVRLDDDVRLPCACFGGVVGAAGVVVERRAQRGARDARPRGDAGLSAGERYSLAAAGPVGY